jgi:uncharacterized membrane protein
LTPFSILLILLSAILHSFWNFITKKGNWPIAFFFWVFLSGTLLYLPLLIGLGVLPSLLLDASPRLWWIVISSGLFETIYFISLVEAYRVGDLSFVYPISRSAPIFTQFWAMLFIGEILSIRGTLGIGLVVLGLFVISLNDFRLTRMIPSPIQATSRPYLLALTAAMASSIYSVIDKVGVQIVHPVFYLWLINLWMTVDTGIYLILRKECSSLKVWRESRREILLVTLFQNVAYLLILMALQISKVSYVVAFRQVGALFGALMGILLLKESHWKTRILGAFILTLGLVFIGLAK